MRDSFDTAPESGKTDPVGQKRGRKIAAAVVLPTCVKAVTLASPRLAVAAHLRVAAGVSTAATANRPVPGRQRLF
jgi:hypothetical protein